MKTSNPYLYFNGDCRAAMTFYRAVFGAEGGFTTFGDMPPDAMPAGADPAGVMHCELHVPGLVLMAGDRPPAMPWAGGGGFAVSLTCDDVEELDRLFADLSDGGEVTTPPHDAFWGDRIGVRWMLSHR